MRNIKFITPPKNSWAEFLALFLSLLWITLLILPAATVFTSVYVWDVDSHSLFFISCWLIFGLKLLLPNTLFYIVSYPLVLFGLMCILALVMRGIDLLELATQIPAYSSSDINEAASPYYGRIAGVATVLLLLAWICTRLSMYTKSDMRNVVRFSLLVSYIALGVFLLVTVPYGAWVRAWPINVLAITASTMPITNTSLAKFFPNSITLNPRDSTSSWEASRDRAPDIQETYVLVIGESVRSDYLYVCDGPEKVRPLRSDVLVACDVSAGSNATLSSVPLLISRDMPGNELRISRDASFLEAFRTLGFETHWLSSHSINIAWADAEYQYYSNVWKLDKDALLPHLKKTLNRPSLRKLIVLHAYNAAAPYCVRYDPSSAPYKVDCSKLEGIPNNSTIEKYRFAYANAVDESMGFLNAILDTLDELEGYVFFIYTPDHGENLLDDARALYMHGSRHPTRWEIQVPAVFWANKTWIEANTSKWHNLSMNVNLALTHADLVPTLLAAAGITYNESRNTVINLLEHGVTPRQRLIQKSLGVVIDWDQLVREAQ